MTEQELQPDNPALRAGSAACTATSSTWPSASGAGRLADDIPWDQMQPRLDPAIADVVESFCAVELYLPDYISKVLPLIRQHAGRAWFHANWGYEESKHSLALGDWLLHSGSAREEQMADLEGQVFLREWDLPHDSACGMLIYAMVQELATFIHYRNLRQRVDERGDGALSKLLGLIAVDERSPSYVLPPRGADVS